MPNTSKAQKRDEISSQSFATYQLVGCCAFDHLMDNFYRIIIVFYYWFFSLLQIVGYFNSLMDVLK